MNYVITVDRGEDESVVLTRAVAEPDAAYLREVVVPAFQPLSEDDYCNGPAGILFTAARSSYVLDGEHVHWCVEWTPGLLVVRYSPDGSLSWASFVSPNPEFENRKASDEELAAYDPQAPNPQYNLVCEPWDAQFDAEAQAGWSEAGPEDEARFDAALARVMELNEGLQEAHGGSDEDLQVWLDRCAQSPIWLGTGPS